MRGLWGPFAKLSTGLILDRPKFLQSLFTQYTEFFSQGCSGSHSSNPALRKLAAENLFSTRHSETRCVQPNCLAFTSRADINLTCNPCHDDPASPSRGWVHQI